jgi:hypothetical protein
MNRNTAIILHKLTKYFFRQMSNIGEVKITGPTRKIQDNRYFPFKRVRHSKTLPASFLKF